MKGEKMQRTTTARTRSRPPLTVEAQENQMVALAVKLAEQQLRDGTASSQVITHYLKLGSTKERLEMERLVEENKLLRAKTESIQSQKKVEELYREALSAMRDYRGEHHTNEDQDL